ncbi:metallophosphoesterase family protein [Planococcus sp. 1R117A]|uniref:metallophosphoesterase family protein n=1 Tax=Planococcus sp. 1R117A TaxID=3447020 RepID=UPI003EDB704C
MKKAFSSKLTISTMALLIGISGLLPTSPLAEEGQDSSEFALREPETGFRVLPYLQSPASTSMKISWVSELDEPSTVTVTGPGIKGKKTVTSDPYYMDLMEYTEKELKQELTYDSGNGKTETIPQGSWLESNANYKHSVSIEGLKPNSTYSYKVKQGEETHHATFKTYPERDKWDDLTLVAFSDAETEPYGALEHREWESHPVNTYAPGSEERPGKGSAFDQKYGNKSRNDMFLVRYPLDQQTALNENLAHIEAADPDALLIAGDLGQGSGFQPAWDEFWRHFAGDYTDLASRTPLLPALGNWETYASINGGYGSDADRTPAVISRNRYHEYFDTPGDANNPQYKDSYYRTDIGPVTLLTLDSTNGVPDESAKTGTLTGEKYSEDDSVLKEEVWAEEGAAGDPYYTTDTQNEFTAEAYNEAFTEVFEGTSPEDSDLPNFNPGTEQYKWAEEQLKDAREKGQIVLVQFHHAAYSNGVHGTPPNHEHPDSQSGVAMRVYTPMFEKYGVAVVLSGHDEMFERSWVDSNEDGTGFHSYDVGVAGDGLRGEKMVRNEDGQLVPLDYNSHSEWSASRNEPELWKTNENGVKQLIDGGLHYGHLQMDFANMPNGAKLTLSPVYIFPILDDNYDLVKTERRVYDDVQTIYFDKNGNMTASSEACEKPGNGKGKAIGVCKEGNGNKGNGQKNGNPPEHSNAQK